MKKLIFAISVVAFLGSCAGKDAKPAGEVSKALDKTELAANVAADSAISRTSSAVGADNVNEKGKPYIVDFYATWCPPCKKLAPIFHEFEHKYADKANFASIDIDKEQALANSLNLEGVPTVIVFADKSMSKELDRIVGFDPQGIETAILRYTK